MDDVAPNTTIIASLEPHYTSEENKRYYKVVTDQEQSGWVSQCRQISEINPSRTYFRSQPHHLNLQQN